MAGERGCREGHRVLREIASPEPEEPARQRHDPEAEGNEAIITPAPSPTMTSPSIISTLETAIGSALRSGGHFLNESELQAALHHELGRVVPCERERPAVFGPAFYPAPQPPPPYKPIDVCEQRESRKVALLAHFDSGAAAIELEFSRLTDWRGAHRG